MGFRAQTAMKECGGLSPNAAPLPRNRWDISRPRNRDRSGKESGEQAVTPTKLFRGSTGTICLLMAGTCAAGSAFTTGYLHPGDENTQLGENDDLRDLLTKTPMTGATYRSLSAPAKKKENEWARFFFPTDKPGLGDAAVTPFGDQVEYKLNAASYNLHLGGKHYVPLQVYFADIDSSESAGEANEAKLLDPTQGVALQFPVAWVYRPSNEDAFCAFKDFKGYCMAGGELTARWVQLSEQNDAGEFDKSWIFGASAGLRAAVFFPFYQGDTTDGTPAGHWSASFGARYYYHDSDQQNLLFGEMTTPDGTPIEFEKEFAAFSVESEIDVYKHFKIRLEYFRPLSNKDALDEVFKASLVLATK
jgi:hypothetical protein